MTTRVSLGGHPLASVATVPDVDPCPLLDSRGARAILGGGDPASLVQPIAPSAATVFGPRGVCLTNAGSLAVSDTGHHRLLLWRHLPDHDQAPADLVIGQPDFTTEGRNAGGEVGPSTMNVPTGIAAERDVLAVADAWNHRVLIWHAFPRQSNQPADVVLGQTDFVSALANRGFDAPRADTLNWCSSVAIHEGRLFVADTGNRRVLVWDGIPTANGAPADLVLGQRDFTSRDENAAAGPSAVGMRWPHAVGIAAGMLFVADAGNSRIMVWKALPRQHGAPCDIVLGQKEFSAADHNRMAYDPTASSLNMPYGLTGHGDRMIVADTANSRLLGFDIVRLGMGVPAQRLAGQNSFREKGENRWRAPSRDSLCWPYAVAAYRDALVIADSGNNRILIWGVT